ncbi:MAG TPA: amidase [Acidimicrobiia bacterium]|nr:amidase [Acidimicrobiia bacterium]
MKDLDPTTLSATQLGHAIRDRRLSAVEVVDAYIERAEGINPILNAIVTSRFERARNEAAEVDRAVAVGEPVGLLAGVPFTAKDVLATAGLRTTSGSRLFRDHVPATDATAVARMRAAGAILLGKTNASEFAMDIQTDNLVFGATRNPWDLTRTSGGSSGGDSAAVASGCSAVGIGTDYGGSLRWPAHCTGTLALRPTAGRIPGSGHLPSLSPLEPPAPNSAAFHGELHVIGPLARTVDDLELALRILAGPDNRDPYSAPVPIHDSAAVDVHGLRFAWCDGDGSVPVRADVLAVLEEVTGRLGRLGCDVVHQRPAALTGAEAVYSRLRGMDGLVEWRQMAAGREAELSPHTQALLAGARERAVGELLEASRERDTRRAQLLDFLEDRQVLLLPVAAVPAFTLGQRAFHVEGRDVGYFQVVAPCRAATLFGLPAVAVPCGRSAENLPVAVQVVAGPFQEHVVLAAARLLEREFGGWQPPPLTPGDA